MSRQTPARDGCHPELGPDLVELVQGCVHGLAHRPDPFQPEPRPDEIRLAIPSRSNESDCARSSRRATGAASA